MPPDPHSVCLLEREKAWLLGVGGVPCDEEEMAVSDGHTLLAALWGALTRFRFWDARLDRRVVGLIPSFPEELVLVLVALLPSVPLPASARVATSALARVQGARDRGAPT